MPRRKPPEVVDPDAPPPPPEPLVPGVARALSPLVRRIIAPNPGMMTGPGTNTYIVGEKELAGTRLARKTGRRGAERCRHLHRLRGIRRKLSRDDGAAFTAAAVAGAVRATDE